MDIEIIDFKIKIQPYRIGYGVLRYFELHLRFDLCYFAKDNKYWIRMPERWATPTKKVKYGFWPTQEISDKFQILTLKKIIDKYNLTESNLLTLYEEAKREALSKRKT
jgi:hypothetical protein